MHKMKLIGAMTALLLIIVIIFQNMGDVETKILFIDVTMPKAVLLVITFMIGEAAGLMTALFYSGRSKRVKDRE